MSFSPHESVLFVALQPSSMSDFVLPPFSPGESENCPEWVMIELQGDLETKSQAASLSGKFIGDLYFTRR